MRRDSGPINSSQNNSSQNNSSQRHKQGFSLLEVMVAISVLSIVVLGVSLIPALGLGRNNDTRTYAVNVAREVLDSYRSLWQESADFRKGRVPVLPQALRFGCVFLPKDPIILSLTIDTSSTPPQQPSFKLIPTIGADIPKIRKVTVTIDCPKAGQTTLSTYIGDPSPAGS
jgi:prepilin-type N-terminal cleavage/methylation domain-containing protein